MESSERKRLLDLAENDFQLKKLYTDHIDYEARLQRLSRKRYLTVDEELEEKKLKVRKLRGKEKMMQRLESAASA